MKAFIYTWLIVGSLSTASAQTLIQEDIQTTFSDYGQLEKMLTCIPGFRGGFATDDILILKGGIELGLSIYHPEYRADSDLGLKNDPPHSQPGPRPYKEGCQLAIDQFKAEINAKEIVEVTVNRKIEMWPKTEGRARRKRNGEVVTVDYFTYEQYIEFFEFTLGGFRFWNNQTVNGKQIKK